jgi:hypothetical protein
LSAELGAAVALGCRGSRTFQRLVAQIDGSSGIVYVNWARLGGIPAGVEAALQGDPSRAADGTRYLHVRVRKGSTGEYLSSIIAHELQHALEVLEDPALVNAAAIEERFARDARGYGGHVFETAAAVRIGRTVHDELRRTRALRLRPHPRF